MPAVPTIISPAHLEIRQLADVYARSYAAVVRNSIGLCGSGLQHQHDLIRKSDEAWAALDAAIIRALAPAADAIDPAVAEREAYIIDGNLRLAAAGAV